MSLGPSVLFNNWPGCPEDLLSLSSINRDLWLLSNSLEGQAVWYRVAAALTAVFPDFTLQQYVKTWKSTALELDKYFSALEGLEQPHLYLKPFLRLCRAGHWQVITKHFTIMSLQEAAEAPFGVNVLHVNQWEWLNALHDLLAILLVTDQENHPEYNSTEVIAIVANKAGFFETDVPSDAISSMLTVLVKHFKGDDLFEKIDRFNRRLMPLLNEAALEKYLNYTPDIGRFAHQDYLTVPLIKKLLEVYPNANKFQLVNYVVSAVFTPSLELFEYLLSLSRKAWETLRLFYAKPRETSIGAYLALLNQSEQLVTIKVIIDYVNTALFSAKDFSEIEYLFKLRDDEFIGINNRYGVTSPLIYFNLPLSIIPEKLRKDKITRADLSLLKYCRFLWSLKYLKPLTPTERRLMLLCLVEYAESRSTMDELLNQRLVDLEADALWVLKHLPAKYGAGLWWLLEQDQLQSNYEDKARFFASTSNRRLFSFFLKSCVIDKGLAMELLAMASVVNLKLMLRYDKITSLLSKEEYQSYTRQLAKRR
jgi:hypothetical protein